MTIKINHHMSNRLEDGVLIADKIEITKKAIIRNGETFLIESLQKDVGPVHLQEDGSIYLDYAYDQYGQFDFLGDNLMVFHDLNKNGEIEYAEAMKFFNDFLSLSEPEREKVRIKRLKSKGKKK